MIVIGGALVVAGFVAWAAALATLPVVLVMAGVIGLIVGVLMMFVAGDTHEGGDSGVTMIYMLACIGSIVIGVCMGAGA